MSFTRDPAVPDRIPYRASSGTYLGTISGTSSSPPNTDEAAGIECGPALSGSGTSLYQSGDDAGRVNEINPSSRSLVRAITASIDEPYGMDMDSSGVLYVANKDDDNIVKISSGGTASVFASGNRMDDPRGVSIGPRYQSGASGSSESSLPDDQNDEPELALIHNGTATRGPVHIEGQDTLLVRAEDPDGDPTTITMMPDILLPDGAATITDHLNGTATVSVNSTGVDAGTYVLWITASDDQDNYNREPYAVVIGQ